MSSDLIGVAGLGLLGRGIATCLLAHGFRVIGFTVGEHTQERFRTYATKGIDELIELAGFPESLRDEWSGRYSEAQSLADFAPCRFVIESVLEDFEIKQSVFDQLEEVMEASAPIASNTSAIPITLLQSRRRHPERFLGMHWSEPAYATHFLELIRGDATNNRAMEEALELAKQNGKSPSIVQRDIPGFIANRLAYAVYREALYLLESGIGDVETIDSAFQNACGLWASMCGPLRWIDITGGPTLYANAMERVMPTLANTPQLPATLDRMRSEGCRGTINGKGFYTYEPSDAALWEQRLHRQAWDILRLRQSERKP